MKLIITGRGVQGKNWAVRQNECAGYSRVYYIKSGEVTYSDNEGECSLTPGCLYVFPTHKPYDIRHNPEKPIECLWFHIDFLGFTINRLLKYDLSDEDSTIGMIVSALDFEYNENAIRDMLYLALSQSLMYAVIKHPSVVRCDVYLLEILEYIRNNILEPSLTVKTLAQRFGYSTAHFIRIFKDGMNITPHRYIELQRLKNAAVLLDSGKTVNETAGVCGYGDVKNFSKAFKKHYGVAPSRYTDFYKHQA